MKPGESCASIPTRNRSSLANLHILCGIIIAGLLALLFILNAPAYGLQSGSVETLANGDDRTAPVVTGFEVLNDGGAVQRPGTARIRVDFVEEGTGVCSITLGLTPSGSLQPVSRTVTFDEPLHTGSAIVEIPIAETIPTGTWTVTEYSIKDLAGNNPGQQCCTPLNELNDDPEAVGYGFSLFNGQIVECPAFSVVDEVNGDANDDRTRPEITGFEVLNDESTVHRPGTARIRVDFVEEGTGVCSITLGVTPFEFDENQEMILEWTRTISQTVTFDEPLHTGYAVVEIPIAETIPTGTWTVTECSIKDLAGNNPGLQYAAPLSELNDDPEAEGFGFNFSFNPGSEIIFECPVFSVAEECHHTYSDWTTTKQPTCVNPGSREKECTLCGNVVVEEIAALDHDYQSVVTEPTCTEGGYTTWTCSRCEDAYVTDAVPATGHSFTVYEPDGSATCETDGMKIAQCDHGCGATDAVVDEGSAIGHKWDEGQVTDEPTCTEPGTMTYTCENDSSHKRTETIEATGHKWDSGTVTTAATYDATGIRTYTCLNCAQTYTETIPALERISLSGSSIAGIASRSYTGKAIQPAPTVIVAGKTLVKDTDYTVSYKNNVNAGTATVTVTGKGAYTGSKSATFAITKAVSTLKVKPVKATRTAWAKKKTTIKRAYTFKVTKNKSKGKVTYKKASGNKKITVAANGAVTVAKGLKKGKTYTLKVKATSAATSNYRDASTIVVLKVAVK